MKQSRTLKQILRIGVWSTIISISLSANAATIIQVAANAVNESWLTGADWSDGNSASAGNDYICQTNNMVLRTPPNSVEPDPVFLGDSLTITNGAILKLKHTGVATVSNLTIYAGSSRIANGGTGTGGNLIGNLALKGAGTVRFDVEGNNRNCIIGAAITADPTVETILIDASQTFTTPSSSSFTFTNAANSFAGTWLVNEGALKGTAFGDGNIVIGSMGYLDFDYIDVGTGQGPTNLNEIIINAGGKIHGDANITVKKMTIYNHEFEAGEYLTGDLKTNADYGSAFTAGTHSFKTITVTEGPTPPPEGDTIYQTQQMGPGHNWNETNYWSNGLAPISTNHYVNANDDNGTGSSAWGTRTPTSGSASFGGASLSFTNGSALNIKGSGPWTIDTLNIWEGCEIQNGGPTTAELTGDLNLLGSGSVEFDAQIPTRTTTISSYMVADTTLTNIVIAMGQTAPTNTVQAMGGGFIISNPFNEFDGTWIVEEGLLSGEGLANGSFLITDMGYIVFDTVYSNVTADLTIEANPTNSLQSGMILLSTNVTVGTASIWGTGLNIGTYTGADLKVHGIYGGAFDTNSVDTAILTVTAAPEIPEIGEITGGAVGGDMVVGWMGSSVATYTLQSDENLVVAPGWSDVVGYVDIPGIDGAMSITNATTDPQKFYRVIGN